MQSMQNTVTENSNIPLLTCCILNMTGSACINITLRRIHITTVAVEKQKVSQILSVYL